jgi:4-hydroxy-3-methylbut-2-enyl diphosphate reductase
MKIQLAEHYGICFGVRDAIAQAERLVAQAPLTILGELVHNPVVLDRLARRGVEETSQALPELGGNAQVMITAHGASDAKREAWSRAGFTVADGTCPLVRSAHEKLRALVQQGCFPVVIGQPGHVEVLGLTGDFEGACVIEKEADIEELPRSPRFGVVSQTTQPVDRVLALVEAIRRSRPESVVVFHDTVCQPTKNRQLAMRKILAECDAVVVVGGRNSNNTRQLVEAARAAGRAAFHIERAEELRPEWFRGCRCAGLTAGTSTLKETVAEVLARLEEIAAVSTTGDPDERDELHSAPARHAPQR